MDDIVRQVFVILSNVWLSNLGSKDYSQLMCVSRECLAIFNKCVTSAAVTLGGFPESVAKLKGLSGLSDLRFLLARMNDQVPLDVFSNMTNLMDLKIYICSQCEYRRVLSVASLKDLRSLDFSAISPYDLDFRSLSELTQLTEICMKNVCVDDLKDQLKTLPFLKRLSLHTCNATSDDLMEMHDGIKAIDLFNEKVTDIDFIRRYSALTSLRCDIMFISSIEALRIAQHIAELSLSHNVFLHDISPISTLTKLVSLNIQFTQVNDIAPLSECSKLARLNINGLRLQTLTPLSSLPKLQVLKSEDCTGLIDIRPLSSVKSLTHLSFKGCTKLLDISSLVGLPKLTWLDVSNTSLCFELNMDFNQSRASAGLGPVKVVVSDSE